MHPLTWLGIALILLGVALVALPLIGRLIDLSAIPWWLVYIHRSDGFVFATSPILIFFSIVSLLVHLLR